MISIVPLLVKGPVLNGKAFDENKRSCPFSIRDH